jgi:cellulose biosynthesis protein BcsQ
VIVDLAVYAEEKGETVLVIDLDPQRSATLSNSARGTNKRGGGRGRQRT